MRIDPKLVIEFVAIAQEGSFTKAAQRLRVAQPWLSARHHKLEELLGFRLLDRTTRSVSLTERGARFLACASDLSAAADAVDRLASQLKREERSVLRIGAAPYTKILEQRRELIDTFSHAHADISVELETGWSLALLARLQAGDIDLTFLMGEADPGQFDTIVLARIGIAITMARENPLAAAPIVEPAAIADRPIQVFTRSLYPSLWDAMHAPLIALGAKLVEAPEMAEGPPSRMASPDDLAAFFDFGADDTGNDHVVRRPLHSSVQIPFQLVRLPHPLKGAPQRFWDLAAALDPGCRLA